MKINIKIEDFTYIDERGYIVIPKKIREEIGFNLGEDLLVYLDIYIHDCDKPLTTSYPEYCQNISITKKDIFTSLLLPFRSLVELFTSKIVGVEKMNEKGQILIPKRIREKMDLKNGKKLIIFFQKCNNKICCLSLINDDPQYPMKK